MKGGTAGVVLLLILAAVPLPTGESAAVIPRAPISIASDADFTAANGVIAGTGTPADPYVIAGWHIRATIGSAILITNTTKSVVIRDNLLESPGVGITLVAASSPTLILSNEFLLTAHTAIGVSVRSAQATIQNNAFSAAARGTGVSLSQSSSLVLNNTFNFVTNGIVAFQGSPALVGNDIHAGIVGISLRTTILARVEENIVTDTQTGIYVRETTRTSVRANFVTTGNVGIDLWINKDCDVADNTVRYQMHVGISFESTSGNMTANVVIDGSGDGVIVWHSPILIADNRIEANLGIGIHSSMSAADVRANVIVNNSIGLKMAGEDVLHLTANVFVNNAIGLDIPYQSRQSIAHMSGNVVNGIAVDGAAGVYHWHRSNVVISGQVLDSGFSAGYFGSLTAQGNLVLYDVNTATITGSVIAHAQVGITAVNSFNVVVEDSVILNTNVGVSASARAAPFPALSCAVSVKNTTINITVDPPLTVGVDARGCLVNVLNTSIGTVDIGIRMDAGSWGNVSGNTITGTRVGLDIASAADAYIVNNTASANKVGARFLSSGATVLDNRFEANQRAGVILERGSSLVFAGNSVRLNGEGVIDLSPCPTFCSRLDAERNVFADNRGDGVRVNGTSTFRGDAFVANRATGARVAAATFLGATATGNGEDGISSAGSIVMRGSTTTMNARHGLRLTGSADLRDSNFTWNGEAGIRATASFANLLRVNASFNFDGILMDEVAPGVDTSRISVYEMLQTPNVADPLHVHLSVLLHNQRDAIRSTKSAVNATHNWFGGQPAINVLDQVGAFRNGVSPTVRVVPWFEDRAMTTTGPVSFL